VTNFHLSANLAAAAWAAAKAAAAKRVPRHRWIYTDAVAHPRRNGWDHCFTQRRGIL